MKNLLTIYTTEIGIVLLTLIVVWFINSVKKATVKKVEEVGRDLKEMNKENIVAHGELWKDQRKLGERVARLEPSPGPQT